MTLVELLVAMVITGIVAVIALEMIVGERSNYTGTRDRIRLQSDSREALRIMEEEVKNAGFRALGTISSGSFTATPCVNKGFANGAYIAVDSQAAATVLGVRFYNPMGGAGTCATLPLYEVDYRWDAALQTLSRRLLTNPAAAGTVSAADATGYTLFLANVDSFSLGFGMFRDKVPLLSPVNLGGPPQVALGSLTTSVPLTGSWNCPTAGDWGNIVDVGTDREVTIKLPDAGSGTYSFLLNNALPFVAASGEDHLSDTATYRIGFRAEIVAPSFLDPTTGLDPVALIKCGFYSAVGVPMGSASQPAIFTFRPSASNSRNVSFDLSPVLTSAQRTQPFYLGVQATMLGGGTSRLFTLTNLSVTRLDKGHVQQWLHSADMAATPARMGTVNALELRLHALDTHKLPASFDRFVQVVNNGND